MTKPQLEYWSITISAFFFFFIILLTQSYGQTAGDFRTYASGNWNSTSTWERFDGTAWINPVPSAPTNASGVITIRNLHVVTVTASVTIDQATVDAGGQVTINSSCTLSVAEGTGTDLTLNGTVDISGTLTISTSGSSWISATVGLSGLINVNSAGTFNVGSRTILTVNGSITEAYGGDININGGASFTRGQIVIASGASLTASGRLDLGLGELHINSNGTVSLSATGEMTAANNSMVELSAGGLFSVLGTVTVGGGTPSTSNVILNGTLSIAGNGNWDIREGVATTTTVNSGSTLIMGPGATMTDGSSGVARFTLASGATMQIGSAAGINLTGYSGNIQVRGLRTFSTGANYTYSGIANQVTGTGTPATVNNLTIDNPGHTVTLTAGISVAGILTLTNGIFVSSAANLLSVSNSSVTAVTGAYSNLTYVDGPLKRNTASIAEYLFPVGDLGLFKKAGIIPASASAADYTIEAFSTPPSNQNNLGPGINYISNVEEWEITGSASSQIKLYWTAVSSIDESSLSGLAVAHYNTASYLWESKGNSATDNVADYVISNISTEYSRHTFASVVPFIVLPVELLYFNVENTGAANVLSWSTASETNNNYFEVQKSTDGINFSATAKVYGAGNSAVQLHYSSVDNFPVSGLNYYRLNQVDYDGTNHYLPTLVINVSSENENVILLSNPSTGRDIYLFYSGGSESIYNLSIYDISGKLIAAQNNLLLNPGVNELKNNIGSLTAGTYLVSIIFNNNSKTYYQKLVVF